VGAVQGGVVGVKRNEVKELERLLLDVNRLAENFYYNYNFKVRVSTNIRDIRDVIRSNGISGVIEFTQPVPLGTVITCGYLVEFIRLEGMSLAFLEFKDQKDDQKGQDLKELVIARLIWRGNEVQIGFGSYTEAVALLLTPGARAAIAAGRTRFSNQKLEEFVQDVLGYADAVVERGVHRAVKVGDMFVKENKRGWQYVVDINGPDDISAVGIKKVGNNYYITLLRSSLKMFDRVGIGDRGRARWSLSKETASRLPAVRKLVEELPAVRGEVASWLDLLKVARIALSAYAL